MFKGNLTRLIIILLSIGACLAAIMILFAIPMDADTVNDCLSLYSDDYELLAECLAFAADIAPDTLEDENTSYEPPPEPTPTLGAIERQSEPNLDGKPELYNTACQPDSQLRIEFEFPAALAGEVRGEYVVIVDTELYQFDPASSSGNRLVFVGPAPTESIPVIQMFLSGDLGYKEGQGIGEEIYRMDSLDDNFSVERCTDLEQLDNPDGIPVIYNATCLQGKNLMVAFEFPEPVTSQYEALIDGQVYQYTPVPNYPNRAYFFGPPPRYQGPVSVSLSTIPDGTVVFEQQDYEFPACGVQRPKKDDGGGDGGYVPPSY
jgi:hypothetical protein